MTHRQHPLLTVLVTLILTLSLSSPIFAATVPATPEPVHAVVNPVDPATAKPAMTEAEAIKKALETFPIPEDLGKPSVNLWSDDGKYGQGPIWNLSWERDPRLGGTRISYNVGINAASGEIVSYSVYRYDPNGQRELATYTGDEAQQFADQWYAKLVSADKKTEPQPNQDYMGTDQNYSWIRVENGIPFPDNTINLTINVSDGTLSSYYRIWDDHLTFPTPDKAISPAAAQAAYEKAAGVELVYHRIYSPSGRTQVKLVYVSKAENANIDALTGELVDSGGQPWTGQGNPIDLGKSEAKLVKLAKPMAREEALALARKHLGPDAQTEPSYSSYSAPGQTADIYGDSLRVSTWSFSWRIEGKEANQSRHLSATVDVDHGVLINTSSWDGYVSDEQLRNKTPISEEVARTTAINYIKEVRPDLINELLVTDRSVTEKYIGWPQDKPQPIQREYYFNFQRVINAADGSRIRFDADNVSISIDRFSGVMRSFYLNWTEPELPSLNEVKLTPAQAMEAFRAEAPLRLTYTRTYIPYSDGQPLLHLVYRPYNTFGGSLIDPVTGHMLDYSGRDVTELKRGAEDIADHPAKREIQQMINRGVFEIKDGKFGPDHTMTRGDVAKALVIAFNQGYMVPEFNRLAAMGKGGGAPAPSYTDVSYDNGYFGYVEAAVRVGILVPKVANEKLNPDELVTNEELALLTARAMGYGAAVKMKSTITSGFTDAAKIGTDYRNAVGLLAGLEVLSNQGEFKPQAQVTRATVAQVLARATQQSRGRYYY